jgi:hypothetical protein
MPLPLPTLDQIPTALRERAQWVVWRNEPRETGGKPTKVPYQARYPQSKASSTRPATWADAARALETARAHGFDGIGYVFSPDDPFAGFDFDDVLDEQGRPADWVQTWLDEFSTYVEVSPSGRGLKGIAIGKLPGSGINAGELELYDQGRYFAITGRRFDGYPAEPQPVNGPLDRLYALAQERKAQHEAEREQRRQRAYAEKALAGECERVATAPEGTRNDTLNRAAFALAGFVASGLLDEHTTAEALAQAAGQNGLGVAEIRGTLRSGMTAGKLHPRTAPEKPADPEPEPKPEKAPTVTKGKRRINTLTGEILEGDAPPTKNVGPIELIPAPDWRSKIITAAQLYHAQFQPLLWTVENVLPEGAALLAGKPKSRKSWAALGVAVACARGEAALGKLTTRQGRVLYLDLESNQRRMRGRLFSMVGHAMRSMESLHIVTDWPRGGEGLNALEEWMAAHPDTVLIVIDVLADFRRPKDPKEDPYSYDRETVKPINEFAERHRVTVLLVHHTRKMKADDVFDEISGSTGLPSAVATMWVLGRAPNGSGEMILALRGRDLLEDDPLALEWDDYENSFKIVGAAADSAMSAERRAVLDVLADDANWAPKDIAAELRKPVNNVKQLLRALLSEGHIQKTGHGMYARVPERKPDHFDHFDHFDHDHFPQSDQSDRSLTRRSLSDHFSAEHQDATDRPSEAESDQSDRDSLRHTYSHHRGLWQVWNPGRTSVVTVCGSEAEARAECERLNGGAQ